MENGRCGDIDGAGSSMLNSPATIRYGGGGCAVTFAERRNVDSTTFPVSTAIAVAEVTVEPGAMRELHWHPTQDEWAYYLLAMSASSLLRSVTYVENIGNTTLRFLEIFNTDRYQDISLQQWLALTPPDLVKAHLGLDDETISHLSKTKYTVVGPA
ncbi:hypothetical protein NUW54_g12373 [Trametes sanguinea]|uniref:Uncharacterized protein n=1 Tax=Trametes sanguinea TaxID=158606 RepID=A0ACC1MZJ3_9APHY|nr:hypothetical protein NUW54_g12373 [Trametes sanguinea]